MSKIEWTDKTWNPLAGCSKVSAGCENCYAEIMARRLAAMGQKKYKGTTRKNINGKAHWTGIINLDEKALLIPLKIKKPTRFFVNSMSDLFHEGVPARFIDDVFAVMMLCPQHTFQILTKRPENMVKYFATEYSKARIMTALDIIGEENDDLFEICCKVASQIPMMLRIVLKNVWLGVSVENQETAQKRIPLLLKTPAAIRFISCEPLLGPIDLTDINLNSQLFNSLTGIGDLYPDNKINWVIAGGESGPHARPLHPDWIRSIKNQCMAANVPLFFKQWGEYAPHADTGKCKKVSVVNNGIGYEMCKVGKSDAGSLLDGKEWKQYPNQ